MTGVVNTVGRWFGGGGSSPPPAPAVDPNADAKKQAQAARDALLEQAQQRTKFAGLESALDEQYGQGLLSQQKRGVAQDLGL